MKFKYFLGLFLAALFLATFLGCGVPGFEQKDEQQAQPTAEGKITFVGEENKEYNLYLAGDDGSEVQKLTDLNSVEGLIQPRFSPDGTKIAFQARGKKAETADPQSLLYVVNTDGGDVTEITKEVETGGEKPLWLDDNHVLFLTKDQKNKAVYSIDVEGVNLIKIAGRTTDEFVLVKEQNEIVYQDAKTLALNKVSIETKSENKLLNWDRPIYSLRISPDDKKLSFVSKNEKKKYTLYSFDLEKNSLGELIPLSYFGSIKDEFEVAWTSDSTRLIFTSVDKKGLKSLVMMGVADKRTVPLTTEETIDRYLAVSPSTDRAVFSRQSGKTSSLISFDLATQEEQELIPSQYNPLSSDVK